VVRGPVVGTALVTVAYDAEVLLHAYEPEDVPEPLLSPTLVPAGLEYVPDPVGYGGTVEFDMGYGANEDG
jgi:hypothetical protein